MHITLPNVNNVEYFKKGKRGIVYTGNYKGKKVIIKVKNPESFAINRIKNEGDWLKRLNKIGIGPKVFVATEDYLVMEFIDGKFFVDFIESSKDKKIVLKVIKDILNQCYEMDKIKVDKEEMHKPIKNLIINKKNKPILIDFERCHVVDNGKNVTQFLFFLYKCRDLLGKFGIKIEQSKIIEISKDYKKDNKQFKRILRAMH